MNVFNKLRKWLIGTGFDVGEKVYWNNRVDASFTGEYVVTKKRDKRGLVGIYNEEKKERFVHWYELELVE